MTAQKSPIIQNITFLILFAVFAFLFMGSSGQESRMARAQELEPTEIAPYPIGEDSNNPQNLTIIPYPPINNFDNTDTEISDPYPSPHIDPLPTPSAPENRLIRWNNGETQEIVVDPEVYSTLVITETDGSLIVPGFVGSDVDNGLLGEIQPNSIIGGDDRVPIPNTKIYPWRAIVFIEGWWSGSELQSCSGWLVGPSAVVTAAHCVYDRGREVYLADVRVTPGLNTQDPTPIPFGSCRTIGSWVPEKYITDNQHYNDYDYGVYRLGCEIGAVTGYFNLKMIQGTGVGQWTAVTGYPSDKPHWTMWTGGGSITRSDSLSFYYNNDTGPVQSGSPIWITETSCNPCAIGTHAGGSSTENQGTRINQDVFDALIIERNFVPIYNYLPLVLE